MTERTWDDVPQAEQERIKQQVIDQIQRMDLAELRIRARSEYSLAYFIAEAFQAAARLLGYIIALPIAIAVKVAKGIAEGFEAGWKSAFDNVGLD